MQLFMHETYIFLYGCQLDFISYAQPMDEW